MYLRLRYFDDVGNKFLELSGGIGFSGFTGISGSLSKAGNEERGFAS